MFSSSERKDHYQKFKSYTCHQPEQCQLGFFSEINEWPFAKIEKEYSHVDSSLQELYSGTYVQKVIMVGSRELMPLWIHLNRSRLLRFLFGLTIFWCFVSSCQHYKVMLISIHLENCSRIPLVIKGTQIF